MLESAELQRDIDNFKAALGGAKVDGGDPTGIEDMRESLAVAIVLVTPIGFLGILIGLPLWVLAVSLLLWQLGRRAAVSA